VINVKSKKTKHGSHTPAYYLHRHLSARTDDYWRVDSLHASDVTKDDFCPRYMALAKVLNHKPKARPSATCEQVVFAQGRMHATMLINWFAEMGYAWGNWLCVGCGCKRLHCQRPTDCVTPKCRGKAFVYVETRIRSKVSGISCGIDLFLALPGRQKLLVVEIKSYDKEKFKALKMPLAEHRVRTSLYLRCVDEAGEEWVDAVEVNEADILYVSKGGYGEKTTVPTKVWGLRDRAWSPFKTFTITRDDSLTDEYVKRAIPVHEFMTGGIMPSGVCSSALATRAENCDLRVQCFSGKYPSGAKTK